MLKIPWDKYLNYKEQPRYKANEWCLYWINFKRYDNRKVIDLVTTHVTSEDEEKVYEIILHGIDASMNKRILIGTLGAMGTHYEAVRG